MGGGTHSHIGLIMKRELNRRLLNIPYVIPVDPGPISLYASGSLGLARQQVTN